MLILAKTSLRRKKKMMPIKTRRTEIQIETHEIKVIKFRGKQFSVRCERCQEPVTAATPEQAAELLRIMPEGGIQNIGVQKPAR